VYVKLALYRIMSFNNCPL